MASDPAATLTAGALAPSEMVLLYGERFTTAQVLLGRTGDPQVELLHADVKVSAPQLGQAILAVALLANDRAGAVRLDPRESTSLFGLRSTDSLFADPLHARVKWPAATLEATILSLADQLYAAGENDVQRIVTRLLPASAEPWAAAAGLVIDGLGRRGLLEAVEIGEPKVLSAKQWVLPDSTRRLAAQQAIEPVERLLSDCERDRPEVWKRLVEQIKQAVERQTRPDAGQA